MKEVGQIEAPLFFLKEEAYEGSHSFFYSSSDFAEIKMLEENWEIIRDEVLGLITAEELDNIKNLNPPYLSHPDAWKNIYFYNFGWKNHANCARFPRTHELLKKLPNFIFGGVTVLNPHSRVLPHNGETNTTIRCHLGLKVPAPLPTCGVKVGSEEQEWKEGKVMMFSDAHYHSTWNESDEQRFVLVFDILREEYATQKSWMCAQSLGALSLKYFYTGRQYLKKTPMPILKALHFVFSAIWYVYLPFQNRLSFLP
jgi:aspartyl/asparaginyl beta-hydroxylase (cupin superfamily)